MEIMNQIGEKMLLSSLLEDACVYSEIPEGVGGEGTRVRRRRKKAKGGSAAEGAEAKKRRLSDEQVRFLEMNFGKERKLESGRKVDLASELGLDPKQVAVWFQNRRARWKSKQLEDEFLKLKAAHDTVVVDKCHLETEVLRLKERVSEAEEEIRKLSRGVEMGSAGDRSSGSPCSSFSAETHQPIFLDEAGAEGEADLMYIHDYNCNNYMMEWVNLYGL